MHQCVDEFERLIVGDVFLRWLAASSGSLRRGVISDMSISVIDRYKNIILLSIYFRHKILLVPDRLRSSLVFALRWGQIGSVFETTPISP